MLYWKSESTRSLWVFTSKICAYSLFSVKVVQKADCSSYIWVQNSVDGSFASSWRTRVGNATEFRLNVEFRDTNIRIFSQMRLKSPGRFGQGQISLGESRNFQPWDLSSSDKNPSSKTSMTAKDCRLTKTPLTSCFARGGTFIDTP